MTLKLTETAPRLWGENLPFWFIALARIASLFLMLTGLLYWADLLGLFGQSGLERGIWQEAAMRVILASAFLIACLGVWQLAFWGVVMWVLSSIAQTVSITAYDAFMPFAFSVMILHLCALVALAASAGSIIWQANRKDDA